MAGVLEDYVPIVDEGVFAELRLLGERLAGKRVVNVNSTRTGGGVAEILNRLIPLTHRCSGILTHTVEGTAFWIKHLLSAREYAPRLGENGHHHCAQQLPVDAARARLPARLHLRV